MAVACQSGATGSTAPWSLSRYRQRMVRSGNVSVAATMAARNQPGRALRISCHTSPSETSCSTHQSSRPEMTSPMTAGRCEERLGDVGGAKADEVEDLFEKLLDHPRRRSRRDQLPHLAPQASARSRAARPE